MKLVVTFTLMLLAVCAIMMEKANGFTSDDLLHPVAHAGGSYVITHVTSTACRRLTSLDRLPCSLIGAGISAAAGVAVEMTQPEETNHTKSYMQNALGIGLAVTIINLDF